MEFRHATVMPREAIELLACRPGGIYVDGTLGGGGHSLEILKASSPDGRLIGIDQDDEALAAATERLKEFKGRTILLKGNFRDIRETLTGLGIDAVDGIILDLGVSSFQFESAERGFSFRFEARLDMRMDKSLKASAYELVNELDADALEKIFREYGEEREARRISRAIERVRASKPIETTGDLVRLILDTIPKRFQAGHIHPATRVFQALRIAVNDELGSLQDGLTGAVESLKSEGRIVVISFHSLEDRIVKTTFRDMSRGCICPPRFPKCVCGVKPVLKVITKKAATPKEDELTENPRARSAKMRAAEKI